MIDYTIENGINSRTLKENPIFSECIEELRVELYEKWVQSDFSDTENREKLYTLKIALELITNKLDSKILEAENEINEQPESNQWD